MSKITPSELDDRLLDDAFVLDDHLDAVPDDAEVVTVCKAGVVAQDATEHLRERGYDAVTLSGGFTGWRHYESNSLLYRVASAVRGLFS